MQTDYICPKPFLLMGSIYHHQNKKRDKFTKYIVEYECDSEHVRNGSHYSFCTRFGSYMHASTFPKCEGKYFYPHNILVIIFSSEHV